MLKIIFHILLYLKKEPTKSCLSTTFFRLFHKVQFPYKVDFEYVGVNIIISARSVLCENMKHPCILGLNMFFFKFPRLYCVIWGEALLKILNAYLLSY